MVDRHGARLLYNPVALGLHVTAPVETAANTFSLFVRRNGSWYALLGGATGRLQLDIRHWRVQRDDRSAG